MHGKSAPNSYHASVRKVSTSLRGTGLGILALFIGLLASFLVAVPAQAAPTSAPVITAVTSVKKGSGLVVDYQAATPAEGTTITGYEYSLDAGVTWVAIGLPQRFTISNLTNGTTYSVSMRAQDSLGAYSTVSAAVNGTPVEPLPSPRTWVNMSFNPQSNGLGASAGAKLGVGAMPSLTFSKPVTDKRLVEENVLVTAVVDKEAPVRVKGAWRWSNDSTMVFRPKQYWPGHAKITITSQLGHQVVGKQGKNFLIVREKFTTTWSFETARKLVAKVNGAARNMRVFIDNKKVKTFPVSLGKAGWESRTGVKVISSAKERYKTYTSTALNITDPNDQYELKDIPWNTRLTPTGEFIHAAPWAYGRIGRWNGSHGCTNMFSQDAEWIYKQTIPGDVVVYLKAGKMMETWNGPGGPWNYKWDSWLKKSKTKMSYGSAVPMPGTQSA